MAKAHESLSVAVMKSIDGTCDRFEAEWKAGKKPTIEKHLGSTSGQERAELLRMLLKLELELQGTDKKSSQAAYEARFPDDNAIVQSVFRDMSERTTSHRAAASADTSVSKDSVLSDARSIPTQEIPKYIGRFEILDVLGQGAFGRVYKARDPQLDRHVAIKVPLQGALGSQNDIDRFLREARAAATLHHPNLCPVHEVGQDNDGAYFIVMAFVDGKTLSDVLKERKEPIAAKQAALIVRKLALALAAAHAKGIVHRDLKPSNVMIERERKDVIIMDFGLARRRKQGDARETREGEVMGTPAYMSPEQARGDVKAIGPASDVYSVGALLYEMLAGRVPFSGSVTEVLGKVLHVEPEAPSTHRQGVDPQLEAICMKAIAKEPAQRFPSMKGLADAIDGFLKGNPSESVTAKPKSKAPTGESSVGLTRVVEALSAERKKERKELEKAVGKHSRFVLIVVTAAAGILGCLIVGGIIVFYFRAPTAIVQVTLVTKIDERLLEDRTISFYFDDKLLSKEDLEWPINLTPGRHVLRAKRGDLIVQEVILVASGDANNAKIDVSTTIEYDPSPKKIDPPKSTPDGWAPLFNGRDLTGWSTQPDAAENWRVESGILTASGKVLKPNLLFTERGDYQDFHFFIEARINHGGNSGQFFRCEYEPGPNPGGYEAQINSTHVDPIKTGSLYGLCDINEILTKPGEWFTQEVIAKGNHIVIKVNGKITVDYIDKTNRSSRGHIALQLHSPKVTVVEFRTVKIKELTAAKTSVLDPDRKAAEWFVSIRGVVEVHTDSYKVRVKKALELPEQPFRIGSFWCDPDRNLTDQGMLENLKGLTGVEVFDTGAPIDGTGFACFHGNLKPIGLALDNVPLTDEGLRAIGQIPQLESIFTNSLLVTDKGLVHLGKHSEMRRLGMLCPRVTDVGFAHLKGLATINDLNLNHTQIGDASLALLGGWSRLDRLTLKNTKVTDAGMKHLLKVTTLRDLHIDNTSVGDAGLETLKSASRLEILEIRNTKISDAAVKAFMKARPGCKIER